MPKRLKIVFGLDVALLVSACALETVRFTGMVVHEWLGIVFGAMVVVHLLLSWSWIASQTRQFIATKSTRSRMNWVLNFALFGCMVGAVYSGVLISREAIPVLTAKPPYSGSDYRWEDIHNELSDVAVVLVSAHLAMNWDWLVAAYRKLVA